MMCDMRHVEGNERGGAKRGSEVVQKQKWNNVELSMFHLLLLWRCHKGVSSYSVKSINVFNICFHVVFCLNFNSSHDGAEAQQDERSFKHELLLVCLCTFF